MISIVIPLLNEEKRWARSFQDLRSFFAAFPTKLQLILAVARSNDQTLTLVRQLAHECAELAILVLSDEELQAERHLHSRTPLQKGLLVREGLLKATGEFIFVMDADLSAPLAETLKALAAFSEDQKLMIGFGSTLGPQNRKHLTHTPVRLKMNRMLNAFAHRKILNALPEADLVGPDQLDLFCGFKFLRRSCLVQLNLQNFICQTDAFWAELLLHAHAQSLQTQILRIRWVQNADSRYQIIGDSWNIFNELRRLRLPARSTLQS